jgi:glyoxylase-like metal-dependent hydrolase (beta-lactamase superfamily II)
VAGHQRWASHFGASRVIHEREATARQGTDASEVKLTGTGPWALPDGGDDIQIIHTPGHTSHHLCLLSRPHKALCTGDHLCAHEEPAPGGVEEGRVEVSSQFNWYNFEKQVRRAQRCSGGST